MLPPLPHHGLTLLLVQYSIYTLSVFCLLIGGVLYSYIRCDKQHLTPINFEYFILQCILKVQILFLATFYNSHDVASQLPDNPEIGE